MQTTTEYIGPNEAAALLQINQHNRPLIGTWVDYLANSIKSGQWRLNGEAIKISKNGILLDGQHRLRAIIKANAAVYTAVARNVDDDVFATLDQGKKRSGADVLSMEGYKNTKGLESAARAVIAIKAGGNAAQFNRRVSPHEVLSLVSAHPLMQDLVRQKHAVKASSFIPAGICGVLTLGGERNSPAMANEFMARLIDGVGLDRDSSIRLLRDRLQEARGATNGLSKHAASMLTARAWNCFVTGRPLNVLRYDRTSEFPEIL